MTFQRIDSSKLRVQTQTDSGSWVELKVAYFDWTHGYQPQDGVLIVDTETATIGIDYVGASAYLPVEAGDLVRLRYDGRTLFGGQVDTTSNKAVALSGLPGEFSYSFTATLVGAYAAALIRKVSYPDLPTESAYKRMTRFVTITNLSVVDSESEVGS